ncbi:hypothetical protein NLJ89_g9551 [Agrocybe chaxingu]|uniref:DNA replication ATP-dependent helicase/nuclease DNA2 n=1 Tax=Agrocybe chaxingu TaxID=84603 RepID=A0A9W8MPR6_9AGAR|nr:hypothetical protein NLJ89_g9551 [Agrocybe chaxingu]
MVRSEVEEAAFMKELMQGLDDSFWNEPPSPIKLKPPVASSPPRTPTRRSTKACAKASTNIFSAPPASIFPSKNVAEELDMDAFLQGSENWDLDDMSFTPIKPTKKPRATRESAPYLPERCTRCIAAAVVEEFVDNRWRKTTKAGAPSNSFVLIAICKHENRMEICRATPSAMLHNSLQLLKLPSSRLAQSHVRPASSKGRVIAAILSRLDSGGERVDVYLYDDWFSTDIRIDDVFNVLGTFSAPCSSSSQGPTRCISITAQENLLILHPDLLLTATALSNAPQCRRKPLLSTLVRSTSDITPALVWGSMLHEVMQRCLQEQKWDEAFIDKCIDQAVLGGLGELVKLGVSEQIARVEVKDRSKGLRLFADKYLAETPKPEAALTNTRSTARDTPSLLAITKLLDVEEEIWSPTYGLKGKLDATVQGIISDPPTSSPYSKSSLSATIPRASTNTPLPLELKTGRASAGMEHRAQTMLYSLLLSERYGADVQDGLLFYTQSEIGEVLAAYMWRRIRNAKGKMKEEMEIDIEDKTRAAMEDEEPFLPPPIDDERACKWCYVQDVCMLFRKTHPNHSVNTKNKLKKMKYDPPIPPFLADIFDEKTGHLSSSQVEFFRKWERLLALEEKDLVRFKRELWTFGADERERRGRCFAGMVLVPEWEEGDKGVDAGKWGKEGKIHRFTYTFRRATTASLTQHSPGNSSWSSTASTLIGTPPFTSPSSTLVPTPSTPSANFARSQHLTPDSRSLLNGHLNVGDPVTVSAEPLFALVQGYILELTPEEVVVGVDHALDVSAIWARLHRGSDVFNEGQVIFRIDKDELFGGMARVRNNLTQLFYANGDRRRLQLVVDLKKPEFCDPQPPFLPSSSSVYKHLNPSQISAIHRILSAQDYALVLGMPGTGKTTVIAALITELVRRGKTVLLTSYTHSAVDTILMKMGGRDAGGGAFGILRLGNVDKVHPEVRKYMLNERREAKTVEQLERMIMSPPVVATTCLTIEHPLFFRRRFDYCIVDEASQITLPTCLGPLRFADTFVLVGDHYQLPPLVKNPDARRGGLDVSLFRRLSDAHPEAVVDLRFQYRMNEDIMLLSNRLIYDNRLRCGNEETAKRSLTLPDRSFFTRLHAVKHQEDECKSDCWLEKLADESCKAVFVDTDALPARDSRVGDLVQNVVEAELIRQFAETLLACGVSESQIGIISLYRQQVKLLKHLFQDRRGLEILTADKSQGRDKDCILVSLVRSNDEGLIGDLVKDWRRMNVSFTRARSKLVIFGSRRTLQSDPLLAQFFSLMEEKRWVLELKHGAHTAHQAVFDVCSTPAKRTAPPAATQEVEGKSVEKENISFKSPEKKLEKEKRPMKKMKHLKKLQASDVNRAGSVGLLRGRPILKDLVGHEA